MILENTKNPRFFATKMSSERDPVYVLSLRLGTGHSLFPNTAVVDKTYKQDGTLRKKPVRRDPVTGLPIVAKKYVKLADREWATEEEMAQAVLAERAATQSRLEAQAMHMAEQAKQAWQAAQAVLLHKDAVVGGVVTQIQVMNSVRLIRRLASRSEDNACPISVAMFVKSISLSKPVISQQASSQDIEESIEADADQMMLNIDDEMVNGLFVTDYYKDLVTDEETPTSECGEDLINMDFA